MGGVARFLRLQAQIRTGLSPGVMVSAVLGIVFGIIAFVFVLMSAFIWMGERFGPLVAALALAAFFLLIAIIALVACLITRNATRRQAAIELAERKRAMALDPKLMGVALQVGRSMPWRWAAPALAAAALAVGVGIQWFGRRAPHIQRAEDELQRAEEELRREFAKAA
jgi:ABC-type nickel/cobalt efflux system permease component RcnA